MTRFAVAAVSARLLAEAAARDGHEVVALDLFGDADTRQAAMQWRPIGAPGALRIDPALLLGALADLAVRGDVAGWVAGSGFEGDPDLLERGHALLPLWGTAARDVRRLRDPRTFFDRLDTESIAHPAVQFVAPPSPDSWLLKDGGGCGGWHIRRASQVVGRAVGTACYFQREARGAPMSATFIADGNGATVIGFNRLLVRRIGAHPFVYCGAIGPVVLPAAVAQRLASIVRTLAAAFAVRGLGSLDFLLDGDEVPVLEVNPRPPASMALYPSIGEAGVMAAHLRACLHDELPAPPPPAAAVRGTEIVFARRPLRVDDARAARLAAWPGCHDLPRAGSAFSPGDPVCSLDAEGATADEVERHLAEGRDTLLAMLETHP